MLGIVDAIIIIALLSFAVFGAKSGFFKQGVFLIGTILCFILAYYLKDYLADFLSYNLPFFKFGGLTSLNILLYQSISFFILIALLGLILGILLKIVSGFEKLLNATVILGIPSKILGFILGLLEGYVVVFISLFILTQPFINIKIINESKLTPIIVKSSPGLSNMVEKTNDSAVKIYKFIEDYNTNKDKDKFNRDSIDIMLNNKIIKVEYIDKLVKKDKLKISGLTEVLNKYR